MTTRPPRVRTAVALPVVAALLVACGGGTTGGGPTDALAGGVASRGAALYQSNCASCHGTDLRGTAQGPPHLDQVYEPSHHGDASFLLAIRRGVGQHHWDFGPMPAIPGLTDQEIADIIAYVREQQRAVGIE